jgi:hypothetical protein
MKLIRLILILIFVYVPSLVYAYPQFIGHGYTSCKNCHYNPWGGGALTDYGRATSATLISSRAFYPKAMSEEQIAQISGFLFRQPRQKLVRTQINYRGFQLVNNPGSSKNEQKRWINMQADARLILNFGENNNIFVAGNLGYAPRPSGAPPDEDQSEVRSREHYLGLNFTPKFSLYAGLMDKVYGLRVVEHIAYSRTYTETTQNDQVHGVAAHYLDTNWELGVHGFVGNLQQDQKVQTKGFSLMTERTIFDEHRVGLSLMNSKNEFVNRLSYAAHTKLNFHNGSAILAEVGQTNTKVVSAQDAETGRYALFQTYVRPVRGLYFLTNIEYSEPDVKLKTYNVRIGPGVQYFPIQRLELRFDIYNTRNFNTSAATVDAWMYLLQTHVWL